jgi:NAD(P)-dependent dehydrogenase (short-subunit alcohol dehydrogenase family)
VDWPRPEERFAARAMMGRIGEPEDIANAVVFLASPWRESRNFADDLVPGPRPVAHIPLDCLP